LIELLVVVTIIGLLSALLLPALSGAKRKAVQIDCFNNVRQLHLANGLFAADSGRYVAAAADIFEDNLKRWHGVRPTLHEPFDGREGPLVAYGVGSAGVRRCAAFRRRGEALSATNAFEEACGGYGYNSRGVGSLTYQYGFSPASMRQGIPPDHLQSPVETVMFSDTAFAQPYGEPTHLIEYSFAEAYYFVSLNPEGGILTTGPSQPSIHFRHQRTASTAWCDGHVSAERSRFPGEAPYDRFELGWIGEPNNDLFDPF